MLFSPFTAILWVILYIFMIQYIILIPLYFQAETLQLHPCVIAVGGHCLFTKNRFYRFLFFCISGSRAERFSLNPNTGELRSASTLRRAEKAEYSLTVTVSDRGAPPQSISTILRIQVLQNFFSLKCLTHYRLCTNNQASFVTQASLQHFIITFC